MYCILYMDLVVFIPVVLRSAVSGERRRARGLPAAAAALLLHSPSSLPAVSVPPPAADRQTAPQLGYSCVYCVHYLHVATCTT